MCKWKFICCCWIIFVLFCFVFQKWIYLKWILQFFLQTKVIWEGNWIQYFYIYCIGLGIKATQIHIKISFFSCSMQLALLPPAPWKCPSISLCRTCGFERVWRWMLIPGFESVEFVGLSFLKWENELPTSASCHSFLLASMTPLLHHPYFRAEDVYLEWVMRCVVQCFSVWQADKMSG